MCKSNKRKKLLYVLKASENGRSHGACCVCSSKKKLGKAVDYWIDECPNFTLAYLAFEKNYFPEPLGWDWCYIAPNSNTEGLGAGGGSVPPKDFWATNLLKNKQYKKYIKVEIKRQIKEDLYNGR